MNEELEYGPTFINSEKQFIFYHEGILQQEILFPVAMISFGGVKVTHTFQELSQWFAVNYLLK